VSLVDTYISTRHQLRGVAESLIAGPQYRAAGTVRLAVRPDGFAGVSIPLAVRGTELILPDDAVPVAGSLAEVAEITGVDVGPPDGVYDIIDPLPPDADLKLDRSAAEWIHRSHYAGGHAIKKVLPEQHPVLWPEHFDVAATEDEVNYGVSAGDEFHPTPYAYVGPFAQHRGPFWKAPFGAAYRLDPAHDVDQLTSRMTAFFERGRRELSKRP
jgi:hypothetical protein